MKLLIVLCVLLISTIGVYAQDTYTIPTTTIDFTNAALAFNSLLPLLFGLITYIVGQLSKTSNVVSKIPKTAWKVATVSLVVLICIGYFGFHVSVVYSLVQAIIGVFVGGGMFSMIHAPLSQSFVKVPVIEPNAPIVLVEPYVQTELAPAISTVIIENKLPEIK